MSVSFLFIPGLVLVFAALPCVVLLFFLRRQERRVLESFQWRWTPGWLVVVEAWLLALTILFLAIAMARPVISSSEINRIALPSNTPVLFCFDVSQSMAAGEPDGVNRLERAREMGKEVSQHIQGRIGVCGFSDLLALHLFPSSDQNALEAALEDILAIGSVPFGSGATTDLAAIADASYDFFPKYTIERTLVVFTDGDTPSRLLEDAAQELKKANIRVIVVGVGRPGELIPLYDGQGKFAGFDTHITNFNEPLLRRFASDSDGVYIEEGDVDSIISEIRNTAYAGDITTAELSYTSVELAPLAILFAGIFCATFWYLRRT